MAVWKATMLDPWKAHVEKLERLSDGQPRAEVTLSTTAGAKRSAAENFKILAIHRAGVKERASGGSLPKRNPWFLSAQETKELAGLVRETAGEFGIIATLDQVARAIGEKIVEFYRQHIARGEGQGGQLAPLSEERAAAKVRKGNSGNPVLVDTGELRDCITYRVRKI